MICLAGNKRKWYFGETDKDDESVKISQVENKSAPTSKEIY